MTFRSGATKLPRRLSKILDRSEKYYNLPSVKSSFSSSQNTHVMAQLPSLQRQEAPTGAKWLTDLNSWRGREKEREGEIDERKRKKKHELKVSGAKDTIQPLLKAQFLSFISEHQYRDRKHDIFQPDKPYWTK